MNADERIRYSGVTQDVDVMRFTRVNKGKNLPPKVVITLPLNIGDEIWLLDGTPYSASICGISIADAGNGMLSLMYTTSVGICFRTNQIGTVAFLSKVDAERYANKK